MYKNLSKNRQKGKDCGSRGDVDGCLKEREEEQRKLYQLIHNLWNDFPFDIYSNNDEAIKAFLEKNRMFFHESVSEYTIYDAITDLPISEPVFKIDAETLAKLQKKRLQEEQRYYAELIAKLKGTK